jgi:PiT family inorganic phosphate transporter
MSVGLVLTVIVVAVVVVFDYTNGFHDASNIIATVIASRAMTPAQAVTLVAACHFIGPLVAGTAVADAVASIVNLGALAPVTSVTVILCGVLGAISWNLATWWWGIPSSSSHALVGGLVGAVLAAAGPWHVEWGVGGLVNGRPSGLAKVLLGLLLSPVVGFWLGFTIHRVMRRLLAGARPSANTALRRLQWVTSAGLAFSHGANDAQKSMGVITLVLLLTGSIPTFTVPTWVILCCAAAISMGILSGGWRIVRTVGYEIYKVRPLHALDAQLTSAAVIFGASLMGAPVSTTHVVSSSITGIGSSERPHAVRWTKAEEIVGTWVITIPGAGIAAALAYTITLVIMKAVTGHA